MKRYVGKKSSIATGVVTAFLAAAPGSSQALPTVAPDASSLSSADGVSQAALDAIRSKAAKVRVAEETKPIVKPAFRKAFAQESGPAFVLSSGPPTVQGQPPK